MSQNKLQIPASIARVLAEAGATIVLPADFTPEAIQRATQALDLLDRRACVGDLAACVFFPEGDEALDLALAAAALVRKVVALGLVTKRSTAVPAGWDVDVGSRIFVVTAPDPAAAEDFADAVVRDDVDASNIEHADGDTSVLFWFDSDDRSDRKIQDDLARVVREFVGA